MAFRKFALSVLLAHAAQAALQHKGADWSSVAVLERDIGMVYKDTQGTVKPLETILFENGINIVRQRVVRTHLTL
jgi:arabinogalactan endo-1,4-beta-galactosidase